MNGGRPPASHRPADAKLRTIVMLGPDPGAVSGVSTHLNQLLQSDIGRDFRVLLFQVGSEGRQESRLQKLWRFAASPAQLWSFLRRHRPDIVHINSAMEPKAFWRDLAYLLVCRWLGLKVVFQVHGGYLPLEFSGNRPVLTGLLRRVLSMPQCLVLLAEVERRAYREFLPDTRLAVVANAIDEAEVATKPRGPKSADLPLSLVYVGRLAHVKGMTEAIDAVRLLRDRGVAVRLAIVGSGPAEADLRAQVDRLGLQREVEFRGAVFGEQKTRIWMEADAFVFPTYHREGLPYALLESMAAGAIPITCPVGAIPDVMQDRRHGLFVEPRDPAGLADAIAWLDGHRAEMAEMARAGRERVLEQYTVSRLAGDFHRIYSSL